MTGFIFPILSDGVYSPARFTGASIGAEPNFSVSAPRMTEPVKFDYRISEGGSHSGDFLNRIHISPTLLQLINPTLNADIGFRLWMTSDTAQELTDISVANSQVLTFDISPGETLESMEYRLVNMQIDTGEPSIDTAILFEFGQIYGILNVLASISETFNLIPDVPVSEVWEYKTNILTNYLGHEQRISLMPTPQVRQEFEVEIIDLRQRREQYLLLAKNIAVQTVIAFYQYGTPLTQTTPFNTNLFYFDLARSNVRVGEFLVLVNTTNEGFVMGKIEEIIPGGVRLNSSAPEEMLVTDTWVAIPCFMCTLEDGSGITMNNRTGRLKIKATTFRDPDLLRPGATRTFPTIDGIPICNRRPLIPAAEDFSYRKEIWDNDVGVREVYSKDEHPTISGNRKFVVQRNADPEEMDFWRSLFDHTRGAQKSFLLSTYFPDIVPITSSSLQTVSTFTARDGETSSVFLRFPSWQYLRIEYEGLQETYHRIVSHAADPSGSLAITIEPAIPDTMGEPVMMSYAVRVRASDRIAWQHYADYSEVSFGVTSTDV